MFVHVVGVVRCGRLVPRVLLRRHDRAGLLAQQPWIVPIPGTTRLHRLEETLRADATSLEASDLQRMGEVLDAPPVEGARHPAQLAKLVGR